LLLLFLIEKITALIPPNHTQPPTTDTVLLPGGGRIIPLSEGTFTIGKDKVFVPFDERSENLKDRSSGSLLVEVQPFCIVLERDILLLDAGLGFRRDGMLQLHQNLLAHGIAPESVTKVLMTHLHKDHAGGISQKDRYGDAVLAFPNAVYFVQRRDFEYAMDTGFPSFMPDELDPLDHSQRVFWLHEDTGMIDNYIQYDVTGGHTPFHQVFRIMDGDNLLFFGGDDAPQLSQMKNKFVAKYDFDGKRCMELRQQWWQEGNASGWYFMFYHDVQHPVVQGTRTIPTP
jgi:hypothetical protein